MAELLNPDICVIGAGAGGLAVAGSAAALGVSVVLVEKGKMGGDNLHTGGAPSKALIAAAARAYETRHGQPFGVNANEVTVDFFKVRDHVQATIADIAPNSSKERFAGLGVRIVEGAAKFVDARTVRVNDIEIRARRFVIATGSRPAIPAIEGLDAVPYFTSETIFDLRERPHHLLVIGAGPTGLELAQAFRRLGSAVTVIEAATPLTAEDPECRIAVLDQLQREGVALKIRTAIDRIAPTGSGIRLTLKSESGEETIEGSHILVATGRTPAIEELGLEAGGIHHEPAGIVVDKGLKTTNRRVYAIGDVTGAHIAHLATHHAELVVRNALFRIPVAVKDDIVPRVTFTDPQLAHVGLTEEQAKKRYSSLRYLRWPFHDNDRAQTERSTRGHVKIVTTRRGKILGVTIVGAGAAELIAPWTLAISQGLKINVMASLIAPYPTRTEAGKRAAIDFFVPGLTSPALRRIIRFLRLLG